MNLAKKDAKYIFLSSETIQTMESNLQLQHYYCFLLQNRHRHLLFWNQVGFPKNCKYSFPVRRT